MLAIERTHKARCYVVPGDGVTESLGAVCVGYGTSDKAFVYDGVSFDTPRHIPEKTAREAVRGLGGECGIYVGAAQTVFMFASQEGGFYDKLERVIKAVSRARTGSGLSDICGQAFYRSDNMAVVCAGTVDADVVKCVADRGFQMDLIGELPERLPPEAGVGVSVAQNKEKSGKSFRIEFTDTPDSAGDLSEPAARVLMDMLAGRDSGLYFRLFSKGVIDGSFSMQYNNTRFFGTCVFEGNSDRPEAVFDALAGEIRELIKNGVCDAYFGRVKRRGAAVFAKETNTAKGAFSKQISLAASGADIAGTLEGYKKITKADVLARLRGSFRSAVPQWRLLREV